MEFTFSKKARMITYVLMGIGVLALVVGFIADDPETHRARFWSNMLINGFFFFAIALGALFFFVLQYATEAAWAVMVKRIFEAIFAYLPYGAGALVVVFLASTFGGNHIYPWMDSEILEPILADGNPTFPYRGLYCGTICPQADSLSCHGYKHLVPHDPHFPQPDHHLRRFLRGSAHRIFHKLPCLIEAFAS